MILAKRLCFCLALVVTVWISGWVRSPSWVPLALGMWTWTVMVVALLLARGARVVAVNVGLILTAVTALECYLLYTDKVDHLTQERDSYQRMKPGSIPYGRKYHVFHPLYGYGPPKDIKVRSVRKKHGEAIFDVEYTIDAHGLRISPSADPSSQNAILIYGGSFAFGEGVEDHQTFPHILCDALHRHYWVYNFAFHGYGPHQMLRGLEAREERHVIGKRRPSYVVYLALPDHIGRVAGTIGWGKGAPQYQLDANNNVNYIGPFWPIWWVKVDSSLRASAIYSAARRRLVVDGIAPSNRDIATYVEVIRKAERICDEIYAASFIVLSWDYTDNQGFVRSLREALSGDDIKVVGLPDIFPELSIQHLPKRLSIAGDWHPNPYAHHRLALFLARLIESVDTTDPRQGRLAQ